MRSLRLNRLLKRLEAVSEGSVVVLADFWELEDCWESKRGLRLSLAPCTSDLHISHQTGQSPQHCQRSPGSARTSQEASKRAYRLQ